jgi:hypothetical protein
MNKIRIAGAAAGVVLVSGIVLQVSSAAFTDTTENAGNSWDAGTVVIDDDAASALFVATNQVPGDTATNCLDVTYSGSVTPSEPIELHATVTESTVSGNGLGDDLDVTLEIGQLGTTCETFVASLGGPLYSGTLAAFATSSAPLNTTWTPDAETTELDMSRPFRFTVTLGNDTPNSAQGEGADATFTWSATS